MNDISFEAFVRDLETVVDAARLDRFSLLGVSQGCRGFDCPCGTQSWPCEPSRALWGLRSGLALARGNAAEIEKADAVQTLMRHGWGQKNQNSVKSLRLASCLAGIA